MSQTNKTKSKKNWATIPLSRVNTIMRSSPEVSSISPDAIALTAHSAVFSLLLLLLLLITISKLFNN